MNKDLNKQLISVIICTYNRCESLADTLKSLHLQEYDDAFYYEIIVVDNNVDNNLKNRTKKVVERNMQKFNGRLRYVFETNQGTPFARNRGIKEARGEIIAFTDDDCIVDKNWLKQINIIFKDSECMGIGGKVLPIWPCNPPSWFIAEGSFSMQGPIVFHDYGNELKEYNREMIFPIGANMAFRKSAFKKYGNFRVDLVYFLGEDSEYCLRLQKNNEKLLYAPNILVFHPVTRERMTKKYFRKWRFRAGRTEARLNTNMSNIALWLYIPRYLFRQLLTNIMKYFFYITKDKKLAFHYSLRIHAILGEMFENFLINLRKNKYKL